MFTKMRISKIALSYLVLDDSHIFSRGVSVRSLASGAAPQGNFGGDAAEKRPRRSSENRGPLKDPNVDVHAWLATSVLRTHIERWWLRIDESAKLDRCATLANSFRGWVFTSFQFDRPLFSNLAQSEIMLLNAFISLYVVFPYESVDFVSRQP